MPEHFCIKETQIELMENTLHHKDAEIDAMSKAIHTVKKILIGDSENPQSPGLLEQTRDLMNKMSDVLQKFNDQKENNRWFWRELVTGAIGAIGGVGTILILIRLGIKL